MNRLDKFQTMFCMVFTDDIHLVDETKRGVNANENFRRKHWIQKDYKEMGMKLNKSKERELSNNLSRKSDEVLQII